MKTAPEIDIRLQSAEWVIDYTLRLTFADGIEQVVDFTGPFSRLRGYYARYREIEEFKNFKVDEGNLVWGENWDVIFPIHKLYENSLR